MRFDHIKVSQVLQKREKKKLYSFCVILRHRDPITYDYTAFDHYTQDPNATKNSPWKFANWPITLQKHFVPL